MYPHTVPCRLRAARGQAPHDTRITAAPPRRRRLSSLAPAALLVLLSLSALPVHGAALPPTGAARPLAGEAAPAPVTLAEVTTKVDPAATHLPDLKDLLRKSVEVELRSIDWGKEGLRRRYKLSAAVMQLETAAAGGVLRSSCSVSAALRDDRGKLLAIIEGRARAEEPGAAAASAERGALEGAVQGAIRRLPEAIRQAQ